VCRYDLLRYTFLEDYDKDPDFPFNTTQPQSTTRESKISFCLDRAPDRLNGQCCSLLEVKEEPESFIWQYEAKKWQETERQVVTFTHRSVYDFLKQSDIQQQITEELQNVNIIQAICHSFLAELKLEPQRWNSLFFEAYIILQLWKTRTTRVLLPFGFLESLHNICLAIQKKTPGDESLLPLFCAHYGRTGIYSFPNNDKFKILSMFHLAAYLGYFDYITWMVEKYPSLIDNDIKLTRIFDVIWANFSPNGNLESLQYLLDLTEKGLKRGLRLNTGIPNFVDDARKIYPREGNVWENFVIRAVFWVPDFSTEEKRKFSQLMKILVDGGADPELELEIEDGLLQFPSVGVWTFVPCDSNSDIISFANEVGSPVSFRKLIRLWELEEKDTMMLEEAIDKSAHT
jgi:hypothetical protein